jgi:hypothetical protein
MTSLKASTIASSGFEALKILQIQLKALFQNFSGFENSAKWDNNNSIA